MSDANDKEVDISIIIPIYNAEKYLEKCLESIQRQTYHNYEVICVNDGSQDKSNEIIERFSSQDSRIKIIKQENQGASVARNNGIREAQGEYIYFCDADDVIHPQLLETVHWFAKRFQADLVSFKFKEIKNNEVNSRQFDKEKLNYKISSNPLFLGIIKEKYHIDYGVWTKLYRKKFIEGIEFIKNNQFEDFPHTLAVLAKHPKTVVIDKEMYFYRVIKTSVSHSNTNTKQIKNYIESINYIYDIYKAPELKKELKYLKRKFIPNILKHQLGRCMRADIIEQNKMFHLLAEELKDLKQKQFLSWRGHKLKRYLLYKKIMRKY